MNEFAMLNTYAEPRPNNAINQEFSAWRAQVGRAIGYLCELENASELLRLVSNKASFFSQALDALYKQARFVEFLSYRAWQQAGLSAEAGSELAALRAQIDAYDEPDTDADIVCDPAWHAIVERAKKAVALLK